MIKKFLSVVLCIHNSFVFATLEESLAQLQAQLTVLSAAAAQLPKKEDLTKKHDEIKTQLDALINQYRLREFDAISPKNMTSDVFLQFATLIEDFENFATAQELKEYYYVGARANLEYIDQKFFVPFSNEIKRKENNLFVIESALKKISQAMEGEKYYQIEGYSAERWAARLKNLLIGINNLLEMYKDNIEGSGSNKKEAQKRFEQLKKYIKDFSQYIMRNILAGFSEEEPIRYKADGISKDPFTQDELALYKAAFSFYRRYADPEKEKAFLSIYGSAISEMKDWVGKAPEVGGKFSLKEVQRQAEQKGEEEPTKPLEPPVEKPKNCDALEQTILSTIETLEEQIKADKDLDPKVVQQLADAITAYQKIHCSLREKAKIVNALEDLLGKEANRYFSKQTSKYKDAYDKPKAKDISLIISYYVNNQTDYLPKITTLRSILKKTFNF
jgi:hypothetical protein